MKPDYSVFDLSQHSSSDMDRLEMGINCGIKEANEAGLKEVEETLIAYRMIVQMAKKNAQDKERHAWADQTLKAIVNPSL